MTKNRHIQNNSFILGILNDFVPQNHLVENLDEFID